MIAQLPEPQPIAAHEEGTAIVAFADPGAWVGENVIARQRLAAFVWRISRYIRELDQHPFGSSRRGRSGRPFVWRW